MASSSDLSRRYPLSRLHGLGRELLSQGKHADAVEACTAVIAAGVNSQQPLLATRAVAYEGLGNTSLALKDGKKMMELDPANAQGYLITTRVLQQMHKDELALKIYQRGLRFCKDVKHRAKLRSRMSKLPGATQQLGDVDPVHRLPLELLEMVLAYLPYATLCVSLKVSKDWRTQLAALPSLWTAIDLSTAKKPVRGQDILSSTDRSQKRVRSLVLKNVTLQNSRLLETAIKRSPRLNALSLLSGGELSKSLLQALSRTSDLTTLNLLGNVVVTDEVARSVVAACPKLVELRFGDIEFPTDTRLHGSNGARPEHLRVLEFHGCLRPRLVDWMRKLVSPGPELRALKVHNTFPHHSPSVDGMHIAEFDKLDQLELVNVSFVFANMAMATCAARLRVLRLINVSCLENVTSWLGQRQERAQYFSKLQDLTTTMPFGLLQSILLPMLATGGYTDMPCLQRLRLDAGALDQESLEELLASPRILRTKVVQLVGCRAFSDRHTAVLVEKAPNLEELAVSGSQLSGVGLKTLVSKLKSLQRLDISDCVEIGPDAVAWARKQGVNTKYQLNTGT